MFEKVFCMLNWRQEIERGTKMAQIIKSADINAEELKPYASLTEAELRRSEGIFIAESVKVIKVALSCGLEPVSFLMEERQIEEDLIQSFGCDSHLPLAFLPSCPLHHHQDVLLASQYPCRQQTRLLTQ